MQRSKQQIKRPLQNNIYEFGKKENHPEFIFQSTV